MKFKIAEKEEDKEVTLTFKLSSNGDPAIYAKREGGKEQRILAFIDGKVIMVAGVRPEFGFVLTRLEEVVTI